ncbi:MAG: hypothetical protein U0P30_12350 [Vicinamibacterales bacterium]
MRFVTALAVAGVLAGVTSAAAQSDESRFYLSVNGAFEPGSQTYKDDGTFKLYDETGKLSVGSESSSGAVLDFGVGARVAGNFLVGASFHRTSSTADASVSGQAPHPIFFDRPRSFSSTVGDMKRTEQGLHLSIGYRIPLGDKLDFQILAGPSQFRFSQEVVSGVTITEQGGAFTAVNTTYAVDRRKKNAWGGHVGGDLSYAFYQNDNTSFRLGAYVRYAEAASDFQVVSNTVSTKIGGIQFGGGLRVRF